MKVFAIIAVVLLLGGCATGPVWNTVSETDSFTDKQKIMVTTGDFSTAKTVSTSTRGRYPVIIKQGDNVYFGVMSGGRFKVPTGSVQVRIDQNEAFAISTDETPDALMTAVVPHQAMPLAGLTSEQAEIVKASQAAAMSGISRAMSPITAADADKSRQIIKQMIHGKKIIYRTVGLSQALSTTGEYLIDDSFFEALSKAGIDKTKY